MSLPDFPPFDPSLDICTLAKLLLGATMTVRGVVGGVIIETEAYGATDPASHSFRGPTLRNGAMFGPAGYAYVYLSYGIQVCLNVVGRPGEAVLIRALQPQWGLDHMRARRPAGPLCAGPGRLTQALDVQLSDNGRPFDGTDLALTFDDRSNKDILCGPRIGITRAKDMPWRFGLAGEPGLSRKF